MPFAPVSCLLPCSPSSSYTSLLTSPQTQQAHSHLRAFAHAVPSAWNAFPTDLDILVSPSASPPCPPGNLKPPPPPASLPFLWFLIAHSGMLSVHLSACYPPPTLGCGPRKSVGLVADSFTPRTGSACSRSLVNSFCTKGRTKHLFGGRPWDTGAW